MKEPLHSKGKGAKDKEANISLKQEEKEFLLELAFRIREVRVNAGITQERFYEDTNIHIGRIETGKFNISINTLYRICAYFKISVKEFFGKINKN